MTTQAPTQENAVTPAAATGIAKPMTPQQLLGLDLDRLRPSLEKVLPKHITADRIIKVVLSATARKPDLLKCTRQSIIRAVMQAGELGLEIGGLLGEAYLVPYNVKIKEEGQPERWEKQVQMIPGYRGFIKLARNSGQISSICAWPVYRGDHFKVNLAEERIEHSPSLEADRDPKEIIFVYAIAKYTNDGGKQIDFMTRGEVEAVRKRSKAANDGPWVTDYAEMARKTVVRRLAKYLPLSPELRTAIEVDDDREDRERRGEATDTDFIDAIADGVVTDGGPIVAPTQTAALPPGADTPGRKVSLRGNGRHAAQAAARTATPSRETPAAAKEGPEPPFGSAAQAASAEGQESTSASAHRAARQAREAGPGKWSTPATDVPGPDMAAEPAGASTPAKTPEDWQAEAQMLWESVRDATLDTIDDIAGEVAAFGEAGAPATLVTPLQDYVNRQLSTLRPGKA